MPENDNIDSEADNHRYSAAEDARPVVGNETADSMNPYRSPKADSLPLSSKKELHALDWIAALLFATPAAIVAFPLTCTGVMLLGHIENMFIVMSISVVFAVLTGYFVTKRVLREASRRRKSLETKQ